MDDPSNQGLDAIRVLASDADGDDPVSADTAYRDTEDVEDADITATITVEGADLTHAEAAEVAADDVDSDFLTGIVWGAGDHNLSLGGQPAKVRVPEDTVQPTFEALREDVEAGEVGIGTDHPDPDSVAAQTGVVNIGQADDVALSADERYIVLTDSHPTAEAAEVAHANGDFDDLDFSIVGGMDIRRDDDGDPVIEDDRIVVDAVRIERVDVVQTGAVDAASIGSVPDLKDHTDQVQQAANAKRPSNLADALTASASAIEAHITDMDGHDIHTDPDDLDAAREQLSAAASVIEDQDEQLEAAQARAGAFDNLLTAHDVDPDDYDSPTEAAQAVIDQQTQDIRQEVAEVEAGLAKYDTGDDDVDARAEELTGKSPGELRNILNARKAEAFDAQQTKKQKGAASAKGDSRGQASFSGGDNGSDADADDIALQAMDGSDRISAEQNGQSPAEYVRETYDVDASQYDHADEVSDAIVGQIGGDN